MNTSVCLNRSVFFIFNYYFRIMMNIRLLCPKTYRIMHYTRKPFNDSKPFRTWNFQQHSWWSFINTHTCRTRDISTGSFNQEALTFTHHYLSLPWDNHKCRWHECGKTSKLNPVLEQEYFFVVWGCLREPSKGSLPYYSNVKVLLFGCVFFFPH